MFNTAILDVALGLIFIYLLLSLMCTAANEIIELLLKKRAIDLERGIRELLKPGSASGSNDIVKDLYNHPLINGLFGGPYENSGIATRRRWIKRTMLPSYIPARNFSLALMDLVRPGVDAAGVVNPQSGAANATVPSSTTTPPNTPQVVINVPTGTAPVVVPPAAPSPNPSLVALREALALASNSQITPQIKNALVPLIDAAGNDVAKVRENIESWYNASMDRVSSWYKRRAQVTILILGLFIAITVNVDTITIARRLSTDKALRDSLVTAADAYAKAHAIASPMSKPTGAETKPGAPPLPAASPSPIVSPSPSPVESPSTSPVEAPAVSPSVASSPAAPLTGSPSPAATTTASTGPIANPTTEDLPAICKTQPTSGQCIREKNLQDACRTPDSEPCKTAKALESLCQTPSGECERQTELLRACADKNSEACKTAKALEKLCQTPSGECKRQTELLRACADKSSEACKRAQALKKACTDLNSSVCKRGTDLLTACEEPTSTECQSAQDLDDACQEPESPKCKYLANLQQINSLGLPIGWSSVDDPKRTWPGTNFFKAAGWTDQIYWHGLGWILTALALSLGAPFWFDLLNKFIVIRSAVKPHEKSPEEGSKD